MANRRESPVERLKIKFIFFFISGKFSIFLYFLDKLKSKTEEFNFDITPSKKERYESDLIEVKTD